MRVGLALFFLLLQMNALAENWELDKDKNGIQIYTRRNSVSDFKEYKGIVQIQVNRKKIVEMVLDVADYVNWFPDCEAAELLKKVNEREFIVYYRINTPWPASDRDAVIQMMLERDDKNNTTTISFRDKLNFKEEVDGAVRVKNTQGYWKFVEHNGRTTVTYQCLTNPGGSIPSWISNLFVVDAPYETLSAIRSRFQ